MQRQEAHILFSKQHVSRTLKKFKISSRPQRKVLLSDKKINQPVAAITVNSYNEA